MDERLRVARWAALAVALALVGAGCLESSPAPTPCRAPHTVRSVVLEPTRKVDLLFMDDNSGSTAEDQASLVAAFPRFLETLTSRDRCGTASPQRIAFTTGYEPAPGATFRVECMEELCDT